MAFLTLEDFQGSMEIVIFPKVYEKYMELLEEEEVLLIKGRANVSADGDGKVIASEIKLMLLDEGEKPTSIWLKKEMNTVVSMEQITSLLEKYRGDIPVFIYDEETKQKMKAGRKHWVNGSEEFMQNMKSLLGEKNVAVKMD